MIVIGWARKCYRSLLLTFFSLVLYVPCSLAGKLRHVFDRFRHRERAVKITTTINLCRH